MEKITILFLTFYFLSNFAFADTIVLKNGKIVEGKIIEKSADSIKIDLEGITITYLNSEIEKIIGSDTQQQISSLDKKENAATYYLKAIELLKYPEPQEMKNKINEAIKKGWQDDKDLEKIVTDNKAIFRELEKGLSREKCDFDAGKSIKYLVNREPPPLIKLRYLGNLLLLQARYEEYKNDFSEATEGFLSALKLASHIAQGQDNADKILAMVIEKDVYAGLKIYLSSGDRAKKQVEKIDSFLREYKEKHFAATELINSEKKLLISVIEMTVDNPKFFQDKDGKEVNSDLKAKRIAFRNEILTQANEMADKYYANFLTAAQSNKESDWELANNEINNLRQNAQVGMDDVGLMVYNAFTGKAEEMNKHLANKIVSVLLAVSIPDFRKFVNMYYADMQMLGELISIQEAG